MPVHIVEHVIGRQVCCRDDLCIGTLNLCEFAGSLKGEDGRLAFASNFTDCHLDTFGQADELLGLLLIQVVVEKLLQ